MDRYLEAAHIDRRGKRHVLGRTKDAYAIWPAEGGPPARRFPLSDEGWREAWVAWRSQEAEGPAAGGRAVSHDYRGTRHALGRTEAGYGVWSLSDPGRPVRTFPLTTEGWTEAWEAYRELEEPVAAVPAREWRRGHPVPVREMRAGQVFAGTYRLAALYPGVLVAAALAAAAIQAPFVVLSITSARLVGTTFAGVPVAAYQPVFWVVVASSAVASLIVLPVVVAGVARALGGAVAHGRPRVGRALLGAVGALGTLILAALPPFVAQLPSVLVSAAGLGVDPGLVLLAALAPLPLWVFLYVRLAFAPVAAVVEGRRGPGALARAWRLSRGRGWRILGSLILVTLVPLAVFFVVGFAIGVVGGAEPTLTSHAVITALGGLGGAVVPPLVGAAILLLYLDARVRGEDLDDETFRTELPSTDGPAAAPAPPPDA